MGFRLLNFPAGPHVWPLLVFPFVAGGMAGIRVMGNRRQLRRRCCRSTVRPKDLLATNCHLLGIDHRQLLIDALCVELTPLLRGRWRTALWLASLDRDCPAVQPRQDLDHHLALRPLRRSHARVHWSAICVIETWPVIGSGEAELAIAPHS